MIETILGGLFGGLLRLAPEVLKLIDKKDERKHELAMLDQEIELSKTRMEAALHSPEAVQQGFVLGALEEQALSAEKAGRFSAMISALVRPIVTYVIIAIYAVTKLVGFVLAYSSNVDIVMLLANTWTANDMAVLNMVLGFWFVGRVYERSNK